MRILVIGAAGRTGRLVVERALGHGHDVRAFVHETPLEATHQRLEIVRGDATCLDDLLPALEDMDAVALTIGRGPVGSPVHEAAAAALVQAMAEADVLRLAAMSAAGTFARTDRRLSLGFRTLIATGLRSAYDDLEAMERRIMASGLDWTIVRPMGLSDGPAAGDYRVSLEGTVPTKPKRISRDDVAGFIVKSLETSAYVRRAVVIAN